MAQTGIARIDQLIAHDPAGFRNNSLLDVRRPVHGGRKALHTMRPGATALRSRGGAGFEPSEAEVLQATRDESRRRAAT